MCFLIHKNHTEPKTARTDKVCYKRVEKTPTRRTYLSEILKKIYCTGRENEKVVLFPHRGKIDVGYHSYNSPDLALYRRDCVVECVIPKGTKYYYNPEYGEYVSETIIVKRKIKG